MPISITQTVTAANGSAIAALCSGNSSNTATSSCLATVGGTAGITPDDDITLAVDQSAADLNTIWMECTIPAEYDWETGDWTVLLDVQAGDMDVDCDEIHICEVTSAYSSVGTLGSLTAIGRTINTNQVESFTINQGSVGAGTAGNKVIIIFAFDETAGHAPGNITWTPTQIITAPGSAEPAILSVTELETITVTEAFSVEFDLLEITELESITTTDFINLDVTPLSIIEFESITVTTGLLPEFNPLTISMFESITVTDTDNVAVIGGAAERSPPTSIQVSSYQHYRSIRAGVFPG